MRECEVHGEARRSIVTLEFAFVLVTSREMQRPVRRSQTTCCSKSVKSYGQDNGFWTELLISLVTHCFSGCCPAYEAFGAQVAFNEPVQ